MIYIHISSLFADFYTQENLRRKENKTQGKDQTNVPILSEKSHTLREPVCKNTTERYQCPQDENMKLMKLHKNSKGFQYMKHETGNFL